MKRILIIDDEPMLRDMLRETFESAGHRVYCAVDGKEALEVFNPKGFDLVITDVMMPNVEGIAVIRALRQQMPDLRIIAMSGADKNDKYMTLALEFGANEILKKPFVPGALRSITEKL